RFRASPSGRTNVLPNPIELWLSTGQNRPMPEHIKPRPQPPARAPKAVGCTWSAPRWLPHLSLLALVFLLLPLALWAEPSSFKFAWLTDTHVGSVNAEDDLRETVKDLNAIPGLSFLILSGDVTEYGSRDQFRL